MYAKLQGMHMKTTVFLMTAVLAFSAHAQKSYNWDNSPYNYNNSPQNWENSRYNYNNSPQNWENSAYNYNSKNGVYDNQGNRQGYQVQAPSGVVNYFDNNGNRIGYAPK